MQFEDAFDTQLREALMEKHWASLRRSSHGMALEMVRDFGSINAALVGLGEAVEDKTLNAPTQYYMTCAIDVLKHLESREASIWFWLKCCWQWIVFKIP